MLKKSVLPSSNNSRDIIAIIQGAKKRRMMAYDAVKALNTELGIRPNLACIK